MNTTPIKTHTPKIRIIKKQAISAPQNFMFEKINDNTVRLQFGMASLEFHSDGAICFKNDNAKLSLGSNGVVQVEGVEIINKSNKNISLDAKQHIYLNSEGHH
jgi:hypothetical protein